MTTGSTRYRFKSATPVSSSTSILSRSSQLAQTVRYLIELCFILGVPRDASTHPIQSKLRSYTENPETLTDTNLMSLIRRLSAVSKRPIAFQDTLFVPAQPLSPTPIEVSPYFLSLPEAVSPGEGSSLESMPMGFLSLAAMSEDHASKLGIIRPSRPGAAHTFTKQEVEFTYAATENAACRQLECASPEQPTEELIKQRYETMFFQIVKEQCLLHGIEFQEYKNNCESSQSSSLAKLPMMEFTITSGSGFDEVAKAHIQALSQKYFSPIKSAPENVHAVEEGDAAKTTVPNSMSSGDDAAEAPKPQSQPETDRNDATNSTISYAHKAEIETLSSQAQTESPHPVALTKSPSEPSSLANQFILLPASKNGLRFFLDFLSLLLQLRPPNGFQRGVIFIDKYWNLQSILFAGSALLTLTHSASKKKKSQTLSLHDSLEYDGQAEDADAASQALPSISSSHSVVLPIDSFASTFNSSDCPTDTTELPLFHISPVFPLSLHDSPEYDGQADGAHAASQALPSTSFSHSVVLPIDSFASTFNSSDCPTDTTELPLFHISPVFPLFAWVWLASLGQSNESDLSGSHTPTPPDLSESWVNSFINISAFGITIPGSNPFYLYPLTNSDDDVSSKVGRDDEECRVVYNPASTWFPQIKRSSTGGVDCLAVPALIAGHASRHHPNVGQLSGGRTVQSKRSRPGLFSLATTSRENRRLMSLGPGFFKKPRIALGVGLAIAAASGALVLLNRQ